MCFDFFVEVTLEKKEGEPDPKAREKERGPKKKKNQTENQKTIRQILKKKKGKRRRKKNCRCHFEALDFQCTWWMGDDGCADLEERSTALAQSQSCPKK